MWQIPLAVLEEAIVDWHRSTHRRPSIEWAMIHDVNDQRADVGELAQFARPLGAHVNLIPLNPTPGYAVRGSTARRVREFRDQLESLGVNATVRMKVVRVAALGDLHCSKTSQGALHPLLEKAAESADVLLLAGDLTDYGLPEEARILARGLTGVRVPVVAEKNEIGLSMNRI